MTGPVFQPQATAGTGLPIHPGPQAWTGPTHPLAQASAPGAGAPAGSIPPVGGGSHGSASMAHPQAASPAMTPPACHCGCGGPVGAHGFPGFCGFGFPGTFGFPSFGFPGAFGFPDFGFPGFGLGFPGIGFGFPLFGGFGVPGVI